jgi:hypothetical protein
VDAQARSTAVSPWRQHGHEWTSTSHRRTLTQALREGDGAADAMVAILVSVGNVLFGIAGPLVLAWIYLVRSSKEDPAETHRARPGGGQDDA